MVAAVRDHAPDVVLHSAAYTAVDRAEDEPDVAWRVNALGSWWVARACVLAEAAMVYVSTDYVFDGTLGRPYTEFDAVGPQGRLRPAPRRRGEALVRQTLARHYVVRTSWVLGEHGGNFVKTMLRLGRERGAGQRGRRPARLADLHLRPGPRDQAARRQRAPRHLAPRQRRRLHLVSSWRGAPSSWRGSTSTAPRRRTAAFGAKAPRPAASVLDTRLARLAGLAPLPPWDESLERLVKVLG